MKTLLTVIFTLSSIFIYAQEKIITGVVKYQDGMIISGVSVIVKNTQKGTYTDFDGAYTITANVGDILQFSYLGTQTQEITVNEQSTINVTLLESDEKLNEVIVIGYGTVEKSDVTGSVSSVKGEELTKSGFVGVDQALAGRAAGVVVRQSSGQPGGAANITIRGIGSFSGSEPLYVIDGIPLDNNSEGTLNDFDEGAAALNPLALINPADIESIEILKDASATAIYGSRGANGVILITTKSGEVGKGTIQISHEYSLSEVPRYIDVMDANEFTISRNEALINGGELPLRETLLDSARAGSIPNENWQDRIFRVGTNSNTNLSFSGGNKDLRYSISSNLLNIKGVVERTEFTRASTRLNLNANLNKNLKVGANINYAIINSNEQSTNSSGADNRGTSSIITRAIRFNPSNLFIGSQDDDQGDPAFNQVTPLAFLENNLWETSLSQFTGSLFAELSLSKSLSLRSTFTQQTRHTKQRFYQNNLAKLGIDNLVNNREGWARTGDTEALATTNTNQLDFKKNFGKTNITVTIGQSLEWRKTESLRTSNFGFENDLLTWYAPNTATFQDPDIIGFRESQLASFFGRANISFNNKWLFTFTGRYDGSSKFAEGNKWGFFPAGALAYKISQEQFIKDIKAISSAKLRLSYGVVGNQAIPEYGSLAQLNSDQFTFGNANGEGLSTIFFTDQLANPNLTWESTAQFDVGLDLGLFKNRYTFTFDYFRKKTTDLLVANNRIPSQTGFTGFTENFANITANGFEFSVNARIIRSKDISWTLNANVSTGKAIVDGLPIDVLPSGYNQGWLPGGSQRLINGEEIGTFFGHKRAGIAQFSDFVEFQGLSNEEQIALYNQDRTATYTFVEDFEGGVPRAGNRNRPGEQLYVDLNGDGELSEADKEIIGQAQPDVTFGINNTFEIGNFDFSFFFDGQFGNDIANVTNWNMLAFSQQQQLRQVNGAWTPDNPSNSNPRVDSTNNGAPNFVFSDRFIEDGSFIRLQNVTLGFNLPADILQKLKLTSLRLYVSGTNLFIISNYTGFNPDVNLNGRNNLSLGHDFGGYPLARTILMGLNITL